MNPRTTYDGRTVDSSSEEWRAHCEATTVLAMPMGDRHKHLNTVAAKRGNQAMQELRRLVHAIWIDRQARALIAMDEDAMNARLKAITGNDAKGARLAADVEARMWELNSNGREAANDDVPQENAA